MQRILFLNLTTFCREGGIEKFNRCFLKGLAETNTIESGSISAYDDKADERYYPNKLYKGFKGSKVRMVAGSVWAARSYNTIVLGHINLAVAGVLIKKIFPRKRIVFIAHGIEVWETLPRVKRNLLKLADRILTVSNFTKQNLCTTQNMTDEKMVVFPNTIDPFFAIPREFKGNGHLRERYEIIKDDAVLFTLARVSSAEQYKGYDVVLECLPAVLAKHPNVKYIIGGKYDSKEKERLDNIITTLKLEDAVKIIGFVKDEELVAHYQMADVFIMPSTREGFGIVFLEAMVCGLPVIAGNVDGSADALRGGELGTLVDPLSRTEITQQLCYFLENRYLITDDYKHKVQQDALTHFGFEAFTKRLESILA